MTDSRYNQFLEFIDEIKEIERFEFTESVRTSDQAVLVSGFTKANFAKTILLKHKEDDLFVAAIIPIGSTVDKKSLVEGVKPKRWRLASSEEIFNITGFEAGGVPPIGLGDKVTKYVDPRVMKLDYVIAGGGDTNSLLKLPPVYITGDGAVQKVVSFG